MKDDCRFKDDCDICDSNKDANKSCMACRHYRMIDSGYGRCKLHPVFVAVAWCRDTCGQFAKG